MFSPVFISAISGLVIGAGSCYLWRKARIERQLKQILVVLEMTEDREDISLPIVSQLHRRAAIVQQQREQLQQQLFTWQSALQAAPIGYLQVDADNQVLWCNQTAQRLLQIHKWPSGQGRLLLELVRSYELDRLIAKTRSDRLANELVWQFHFGYQEATNSQSIWLKASSMPLAADAIGVFIESQQEQVDAGRARERWLGDLAHEIRTPLTAIHLLAETLQAKVSPDLTRWADRILKETNRSIDLVQHFSELSRLESASSQSLRLEKVDLIRLIEDVWHTLEPIAKQRQIATIQTVPNRLILNIDPARFTQVLINLFDNSLKYCPDRGHIWIDIHPLERSQFAVATEDRAENSVVIDLYDDGGGFSPQDLPHVFERLYRGDVSRQRQPQTDRPIDSHTTGSGLGLAIVRQIILAHQGTIVAKNHPHTGGAWFQIVLPKSEVTDRFD
jgi:two-component system, OmpR family, phosphate regulon sensor histidine kinase PhoR